MDPVISGNSTSQAGYTPLHTACHFGQANMVRFLLEHEASVNATTKVGTYSIWFILLHFGKVTLYRNDIVHHTIYPTTYLRLRWGEGANLVVISDSSHLRLQVSRLICCKWNASVFFSYPGTVVTDLLLIKLINLISELWVKKFTSLHSFMLSRHCQVTL